MRSVGGGRMRPLLLQWVSVDGWPSLCAIRGTRASCRHHLAPTAGGHACKMGAVRDLEERPITFDYEYKMSCPDCPGITTLTSAEYFSEPNGAHVRCARCGSDIHFGPAVMTLRDASDPALENQRACRFAWYHTSTEPGWSSAARSIP